MSDQTSAEEFDFEGYRRFIGQLLLRKVWLDSAKIENRAGPDIPEHARVVIDDDASWAEIEGGFRATIRYRIRLRDGSRVLAIVDATYAVDYASALPMTGAFFGLFKEANLPLNAWPYLREFVANALSRMGWTPFTLPAFKVNVAPDASGSESPPAPRRRRSADRRTAGVRSGSKSFPK